MSRRRKNNKSTGWLWKPHEAVVSPYASKVKRWDENGNEITGEEDEYGLYGNEDWDRKPSEEGEESKIQWGEYEKTGHWRGYDYYKPATLSYSYVQQMANMIASSHNVNVRVGNGWGVDIAGKTLTYNPVSLMYMSKGEVLATLLHEVGKISMCLPSSKIKNEYLDKYKEPAYESISAFDDFRVDDTMIKSYPAAPEVYESQDEILKKVVSAYKKRGDLVEKAVKLGIKSLWQSVRNHIQESETRLLGQLKGTLKSKQIRSAIFPEIYEQYCSGIKCPFNTEAEYEIWVANMLQTPFPTIYHYIAILVDKGYGINHFAHGQDMEDRFLKTKEGVEASVKSSSTQEVADMMNIKVFPHIEDLLKSFNKGSEEMQKQMGEGRSQQIMKDAFQGAAYGMQDEENGYAEAQEKMKNTISRGSMAGSSDIPQQWVDGDYKPLKESVSSEIKSLYQKLINLRRTEAVQKYSDNHRRGKLNQKSLYRHATGNRRLFRKKEETIDTIRSFTFSIMVDTSGSMSGSKIVHTVRSFIMLAEVFTKLGMKFEIVRFEDNASIIKNFDDVYDKKIQKKVAGLAKADGGGTHLSSALKKSGITKRPEKNRVAIILTDGDTEPYDRINAEYFTPWEKQGIRSIVLGLETPIGSIRGLNNGKGVAIKNAAEVPQVFYQLLKSLIFKK